jgi:hypothetical protein
MAAPGSADLDVAERHGRASSAGATGSGAHPSFSGVSILYWLRNQQTGELAPLAVGIRQGSVLPLGALASAPPRHCLPEGFVPTTDFLPELHCHVPGHAGAQAAADPGSQEGRHPLAEGALADVMLNAGALAREMQKQAARTQRSPDHPKNRLTPSPPSRGKPRALSPLGRSSSRVQSRASEGDLQEADDARGGGAGAGNCSWPSSPTVTLVSRVAANLSLCDSVETRR